MVISVDPLSVTFADTSGGELEPVAVNREKLSLVGI